MKYYVTGVMSGTSLDGLDIAHCMFDRSNDHWSYEIIAAATLDYPARLREKLRNAASMNARECWALHVDYGHFTGEKVRHFLDSKRISQRDLVASHGHTVFHQPDKGYTFQMGHGAAIAAAARCTTVSDFRSMDVSLGGQGAPLVPPGDRALFGDYDFCLNLGGFSNISYEQGGSRVAFDICPFNFVINQVVESASISASAWQGVEGAGKASPLLTYDPEGIIGSKGKTDKQLLEKLNNIVYYKQAGPKSLGEEWVHEHIKPIMDDANRPVEDILHTFYRHAAIQISRAVGVKEQGRLLITGGGAYNNFFIDLLRELLPREVEICIPDKQTIDFKEALVFAFLGLLCTQKQTNCLSSVTGSMRDAIGGCIHYYP